MASEAVAAEVVAVIVINRNLFFPNGSNRFYWYLITIDALLQINRIKASSIYIVIGGILFTGLWNRIFIKFETNYTGYTGYLFLLGR